MSISWEAMGIEGPLPRNTNASSAQGQPLEYGDITPWIILHLSYQRYHLALCTHVFNLRDIFWVEKPHSHIHFAKPLPALSKASQGDWGPSLSTIWSALALVEKVQIRNLGSKPQALAVMVVSLSLGQFHFSPVHKCEQFTFTSLCFRSSLGDWDAGSGPSESQ